MKISSYLNYLRRHLFSLICLLPNNCHSWKFSVMVIDVGDADALYKLRLSQMQFVSRSATSVMLNNYFPSVLLKFNKLLRDKSIRKLLLRSYGRVHSEEFEVSQFCEVQVNCPYSISIQPIDVFRAQEKVVVNLEAAGGASPNIRCEKNGDTVVIEGEPCPGQENVRLKVETSVKASIKATSDGGSIHTGSFYGKYVDLNSTAGDIVLSKSQCEWINAATKGGNIMCSGVLQAADIKLSTEKTGSITTGRVQGLKLRVTTTSGNINTGSTYCDSTEFKTDFGSLHLQNVHKNVIVNIDREGILNISGFDGTLMAVINKGQADIQLSRVIENSLIVMKDESKLTLRISDECQENTAFRVSHHKYVLSPMNMEVTEPELGLLLLEPKRSKSRAHVIVDCKESHVVIGPSSWLDVFNVDTNYKIT